MTFGPVTDEQITTAMAAVDEAAKVYANAKEDAKNAKESHEDARKYLEAMIRERFCPGSLPLLDGAEAD